MYMHYYDMKEKNKKILTTIGIITIISEKFSTQTFAHYCFSIFAYKTIVIKRIKYLITL